MISSKYITRFSLAILLNAIATPLLSQCIEIEEIIFYSNETITVVAEVTADDVIFLADPEGADITDQLEVSPLIMWTGNPFTELVSGHINWVLVLEGNVSCSLDYALDLNAIISYDDIVISGPTTCNGDDGSICLDMEGYENAQVYLDGSDNPSACIAGLPSGDYTVIPEPLDVDGVIYRNCPQDISILQLEAALVYDQGADVVVALITGAALPCTYSIDGFDPDSPCSSTDAPLPFCGPRCYALEVADANGCVATTHTFLTDTFEGDLDSDTCVGTTDLLGFLGSFDAALGDVNYKAGYDFNCDGLIGTTDLLKFLAHFGNCV